MNRGEFSKLDPLGRCVVLATLGMLIFSAWSSAGVFRSFIHEDAFITYRYADNLAGGLGFVFQQGERVLGTSTPLLTQFLAVIGLLGTRIADIGSYSAQRQLDLCTDDNYFCAIQS